MAKLIVHAKERTIVGDAHSAKAAYDAVREDYQRVFGEPMPERLRQDILACHFLTHITGIQAVMPTDVGDCYWIL
jgi:hypothetical protein